MKKCPIQHIIDKLPHFAGLPVPASVLWVDGKPDFRQLDPAKFIHSYKFKLCAVCGSKLSFSVYWIGGDRSKESHYFTDGPQHKECAELSIRLCPFLNGSRQHYRGDDVAPIPEQDSTGRPEQMFLLRGDRDAIELRQLGPESFALWAGDQLTVVKEF